MLTVSNGNWDDAAELAHWDSVAPGASRTFAEATFGPYWWTWTHLCARAESGGEVMAEECAAIPSGIRDRQVLRAQFTFDGTDMAGDLRVERR